MRTTHTALVKVTSLGSGGRAEIRLGHPALTSGFTDPYLTNYRFAKMKVGDHATVRIMLSGNRRHIQTCSVMPEPLFSMLRNAFFSQNLDTLFREYDDYFRRSRMDEPTRDMQLWLKNLHMAKDQQNSESGVQNEEPPIVVEVPEVDDTNWETKVYIDPNDNLAIDAMRRVAELRGGRHVCVLMVGPSGYGKTSIPQQKAKDWGLNYYKQDCANVRDPEEFFGMRGAVDGSTMEDGKTIFMKTEFTRRIEEGNCVIVLDELNRTDSYITNILFPLLDHSGRTNIAGYDIVVGPNVVFFATANIGYQFTGTFTLDTALVNRFSITILVDALPKDVEVKILSARGKIDTTQAHNLVSFMTKLREQNKKGTLSIDASTRVSIQLAELLGAGLNFRTAVTYVIANRVSPEEAKTIADVLS